MIKSCGSQVWKGQGSRKWKLGQNDGIFVQFESPSIRNVWFIPSSKEKGQTLCRFFLSLTHTYPLLGFAMSFVKSIKYHDLLFFVFDRLHFTQAFVT